MLLDEMKNRKALEQENRRLKKRVADLRLDKQALQDLVSRKMLRPAIRRRAVDVARAERGLNGLSPKNPCGSIAR